MPEIGPFSRREFVATTGTAAVASLAGAVPRAGAAPAKARYAMVGTGHRGTSMWGAEVLAQHPDAVEFVGLCDINPLRLEAGRKLIGVTCPTFTDFDQMLTTAKPDTLAVTTTDSEHHKFIIKGLERGIRVITEKPMATRWSDGQAMVAACDGAGVKLFVVKQNRQNATIQLLKRALDQRRRCAEWRGRD